jgi:hypothetical protein
MNQFIITEKIIAELIDYSNAEDAEACIRNIIDTKVRPHPYNPQSELEIKYPSSTSLLLIAHDEWKRRQERKHMDDESPWISGWISGYLTSKKFVQDRIEELLKKGGGGL